MKETAKALSDLFDLWETMGDVLRTQRFAANKWEEMETLEIELETTGRTSRKVRGRDMWRGLGVDNGLRNMSDVDVDRIVACTNK